jgi:hypothetical protein
MTYVEYLGQRGETKRYVIQLGIERVEAMVNPESVRLKVGDTVLNLELSDIVALELAEGVAAGGYNPAQVERANDILGALGRPLVGAEERTIPLDGENPNHVRVRHYIGKSKAQDIVQRRQFGGNGHTLDQGLVFVELATAPVLSSADFITKYAITHGNRGHAYFEFLVRKDEISTKVNPRTGQDEYVVQANGQEDGQGIYKIMSEIELHD